MSPRDYEAPVLALYRDDPGYPARWPVEYRVRVLEGLTQDLERAALDLGDGMGSPFFAEPTLFGWAREGARKSIEAGILESTWTAAPEAAQPAAQVGATWREHLGAFRFLERAAVKIKAAQVTAEGGLSTRVALELAGLEKAGGWRRDFGWADATFSKGRTGWQLSRFRIDQLTTHRRSSKLFEDVTERWVQQVPPATKRLLRAASASDDLHTLLVDEKQPLPEAFDHLQPLAMDSHPGAAVVDLDGDHLDDLFVWDVRGNTVFLENKGGTFVDATDARDLRFRDVSAAAFADLDNDGDQDLVLGRWFGASEVYLAHRGRFLPANANRFGGFPANVATVSVADVNRDGLLDLYFGTAAHDFHRHLGMRLQGGPGAVASLEPGEQALLERAVPEGRRALAEGRFDPNVDQLGPPNVLLLNRGGGNFTDATAALGLELFRNTLQASFADVDGDGWVDLFVANDFAPANLLLNRRGRFEDVSAQSGAEKIIFGMGASWGDFDNDGDLDLYASAMQSSAGERIMSDAKNFASGHSERSITARLAAARGNTLLRNEGNGRFTDATAEKVFAPARRAQWAYSSQFIDADGDGHLDLFAPNGFFTSSQAPPGEAVRDL